MTRRILARFRIPRDFTSQWELSQDTRTGVLHCQCVSFSRRGMCKHVRDYTGGMSAEEVDALFQGNSR